MQQTPITLTAAELYVLREPNTGTGREAFKLTLTELLAQGVIRFQRETKMVLWIFPKQVNYLVSMPASRARASTKPHVQQLLNLISNVPSNGMGAEMGQVVEAAHRTFGKDLAKYKTDLILPTLLREGYLQKTKTKTLGVFSRTAYDLTAKGQETVGQLNTLMQQAEHLPEMAARNPEAAAGVIGLLGAGLMLMPELRPHYGEIGEGLRLHRQRTSGGDGGDSGGEDGGGAEGGVIDFASGLGGFGEQLNAGFAGIFESVDGAMESIDNVLDSFDSSFDSADSSDGGDGGDGGGDGGGD